MILLLFYFSLAIALDCGSLLVEAWALTKLWAWFVATPFAIPWLSLPVAAGLVLTMAVLMPRTYSPPVSQTDPKIPKEPAEKLKYALALTWEKKTNVFYRVITLLIFGWAIHRWWLS